MRPHRITITTSTFVAICFALSPAVAAGSPLLSGYGGPGAGEQQIIGSTLVGGGAGDGGGRSTGGGVGPSRSRSSAGEGFSSGSSSASGPSAGEESSGAGEAEAGSGGAEGATTAKSGSSSPGASGRKGGAAAHRSESSSGKAQSGGGAGRPLPSATLATNERPLLFGLSSGDVLLAASLFVALLLIGALTSWLQVLERKRFGADDAHMGHSGAR